MKKFFWIAAVAAMCLTACNKTQTAEENLDFENATPEAVVSSLSEKVQSGDATAIAEAVATVKDELNSLIESGDVEKITAYASQIKTFVEENAEALKGFNIDVTPLTNIFEQVKAIPGNAEEAAQGVVDAAKAEAEATATEAVEDAKAKATEAVEDAKAKATEAVEDAKAKANEAVEDAKAKANEKVEEGKAKANEAIQNAANKIKL